MNSERLDILAQRKRILAKLMSVDDTEVLNIVETLLDQPGGNVGDSDEVARLMRDMLRVLTGAGRN
jgi:hypothetical protein